MSKNQKSLMGGISILSIAGLICKIIGVLYKIPLARTIGSVGMGVYQQVFPTYNLLLTISSVGIPVAISRMVAARLVYRDTRNAKRVFQASLILLAILGIIGTFVMAFFSKELAHAKDTHSCQQSYIAIAPSLLIVCVMSAYRGYMQGRRRMAPTAVSQIIEQVGKVAIAMPIAAYGMESGDYALGAAGAMLGVSLAEALALLYMFIDERLHNKELECFAAATIEKEAVRNILKEVISISVPISIGAAIVPIAAEVDSLMLVRLMKVYLDESSALVYYGIYTGLVFPLINVPTALAMATAISLVPAVSSALAESNAEKIRKESMTGLRFASLIGFPSSIGLSLLAEPIIILLFSGDKYAAEHLVKGAQLLSVSALTIVLFIHVQTTSGILQGLNKQKIPMYTLLIGVCLKVFTNYMLIRNPAINIHGAPFASIICYTVSFVPNLYYVRKYTGLRLDIGDLLLRPLCATAVMALSILLLKRVFSETFVTSWLVLLLTMMISIVVYTFAVIMFKAVRKEELPASIRRFIK